MREQVMWFDLPIYRSDKITQENTTLEESKLMINWSVQPPVNWQRCHLSLDAQTTTTSH